MTSKVDSNGGNCWREVGRGLNLESSRWIDAQHLMNADKGQSSARCSFDCGVPEYCIARCPY